MGRGNGGRRRNATTPIAGIVPEDGWHDLLQRCRDEPGTILALGGVDVGKTSLCRWLSHCLADCGDVTVIDADLGQSRIGPPASIGLRRLGQTGSHFCFIGDTSPARCEAATLGGLVRIARLACSPRPKWLIVDTSGWVTGAAAVELKLAKLELLGPRHVLALQRGDELEPILRAIRPTSGVRIHRLCGGTRLQPRSALVRAHWRRDRFAYYLQGSSRRWIAWRGKALVHLPRPQDVQRGQLVGLNDTDGFGVCIGLLQEMDYGGQRALILCPAEGNNACGLHFGRVVLDLRRDR